MVYFALVVLKFLMFKIRVIIGISKIDFFNLPVLKGLNKIKKTQKPFKTL